MIITDVNITNKNGSKLKLLGAAQREIKMLPSGLGVMEFTSALGSPLGVAVLEQGMLIEYVNPVAASSQVDALSGLIKVGSETDNMEDGA